MNEILDPSKKFKEDNTQLHFKFYHRCNLSELISLSDYIVPKVEFLRTCCRIKTNSFYDFLFDMDTNFTHMEIENVWFINFLYNTLKNNFYFVDETPSCLINCLVITELKKC